MNIINYDGKRLRIGSPKEAADMVQLLANHLDGLRRDVANIARDVVETAKKVGGGTVPPLSVASLLPNLMKTLPAPSVSPTPTTVTPAKSVHRTATPTAANGTNTIVALDGGSTDRLIRLSIEFTNYQAGDPATTITFGAAYAAIPVVIPVQKGGGAAVNLRPLTVVEGQVILTADSVVGPTTVDFDLVVVPPSVENFD